MTLVLAFLKIYIYIYVYTVYMFTNALPPAISGFVPSLAANIEYTASESA